MFLGRTATQWLCSIICVTAPFLANANAEDVVITPQFDVRTLTQSFDQIIATNERPFYGVILLVQAGKPIYQRQHAVTGQALPDSHSEFLLASQSKMITAAVVLNAVDERKLALDKPLNEYLALAGLPLYHPDIKIYQLLNHSSGIAPLGQENRFTPGSQFQYSNLGYEVLAKVLAYLYQQPFATRVNQFLKIHDIEGINANLGAYNITGSKTDKPTRLLGFETQSDESFEEMEYNISPDLLPGGGMVGSAAGLIQYLQALHGGKLLAAAQYQQMVAPSIRREHRWPELYYGYGVQITPQAPVEYSHSGYLPGFQSLSLSYPESQTYLVILENVSWPLDNVPKVFGLHDKLRNALREQLTASQIDEKINP